MSVQTDLEARTAKLRAILEESNEVLAEKGGTAADDLAGLPAAIAAIEADPELESITVTPTGKAFTTYPDGDGFSSVTVLGDSDLIPDNVKAGVTIYGVTGTHVGGSEYPALEIPSIYNAMFEHCIDNLYSGAYEDIMIMEWFGDNDSCVCCVFMTEDFEVRSFDPDTSEFTAVGWFSCVLTQSTNEWTTVDYRNTVSPGGNYAKHIVFASRYIEYGDSTLFPVGVNSNIINVSSADALPTDAADGTIAIVG